VYLARLEVGPATVPLRARILLLGLTRFEVQPARILVNPGSILVGPVSVLVRSVSASIRHASGPLPPMGLQIPQPALPLLGVSVVLLLT
jgi:hypothetical protein